jgi:hypothetical protein
MLTPSLQRNNGITSTESKHPFNNNLFNNRFILSRAPEIYLPKAVHQAIEAGTNTSV